MDTSSADFKVRYLNEYRLIYDPTYHRAMSCDGWVGYVYEHIVVAERSIGRQLLNTEVVHHLDLNRSNNHARNLLVIDRGQHGKLHAWLSKGAPMSKDIGMQGMNSGKPKSSVLYCSICGLTLQHKQEKFCSVDCELINRHNSSGKRTKPIPSKDELIELNKNNSREAIGRIYNVSGNAVKKWMIKYALDTRILSQAKDKSLEGAETSGEVHSS